jgi:ribosomal protein S18 acetylase RimI-like enzyme
MHIRPMTEDDHHRVSQLLCTCYRWLAEREAYTTEHLQFVLSQRGSVETVRTESREQTYLVAVQANMVVGMVATKDNLIAKICVDPDYHRRGIRAMLFRSAEQTVSEGGFTEMIAGTRDEVVPFYQAMGMAVTERRPCRMTQFDGREVVIMKKRLARNQNDPVTGKAEGT